ncbi:hypothetical protein GCM10027345_38120 [Hymenobacter daeguensis]
MCGCLAQSATAQTPQPAPRYYVGAAFLYRNTYEVAYPSGTNWASVGPWHVVAGASLSPRLAVQVGYAYTRQADNQDPYIVGFTTAGELATGSRRSSITAHAIPLLARYQLMQRGPLGLQALGGLTGWHSTNELDEVNTVAGRVVSGRHLSERAWQLYGSLGLGATFLVGRHVEAVADLTWNKNVQSASADVHRAATGNSWGITNALSFGLRYRFDLNKKAAAAQ